MPHFKRLLFCFSGSTVKCGCPHSEVWFMCSVFWPALSSFPAMLLFLLSLGYVVYIYSSPNSDVLTWNVLSSLPAMQNLSFQGPALCNSFGNLLTISVPSYFSHLRSGCKRGLLCAQFAQSRPTLFDPMDCIPPSSSAQVFPRQESWSGLPFPTLWDFPDPGIEPASSALADKSFTTVPSGKPQASFNAD